MNTQGFQLPVYIAKSMYTSGHVADLGPLQLGIFDRTTNYVATAAGNGKEFYLSGGSSHTKDQLSKWFKGMKQRKDSTPFFGRDIEAFEKISPVRPQNEAWVLGYGGAKNDPSLSYVLGKTYKLKIRLYGDPAFYHAQNSVEKIIPLYTGCVSIDDCDTTCEDTKLGVKKQTRAWAKAINNNIELAEFKIKAAPIFSDYAATTSTRNKYTLSVTDGGGIDHLQDVQRAYPSTYNITQKSYANGVSIYETDFLTSAPTDFTPKTYSYPVTNCDECTAGTFVDNQFTYIVRRPTTPSTDLDDAGARVTYAASIVTAYSGVTDSGVYLGLDEGNAVVKFNAAAAKTALFSDVLEQIAFTTAHCTTVAASAVAWVVGDGGYIVTRTATLTVSNEDCDDAPTLAQVQAHLSSLKNGVAVTDITDTVGTGIDRDNCTSVFQVVQNSFPMEDEYCMTSDNQLFEDLPSYKGAIWEETDTTDVYDATIKAGLRITAPFYSVEFGDCSYDLNERWDAYPLRMELSLYDDEGIVPCDFTNVVKARRVQAPKYQRLNGAYVRHEYIVRNAAYFPYAKWQETPRGREIVDNNVLNQVKGDVYYVEYRLKYKELRDTHNFNQKKQHWSPRIFVEEGDLATQTALENALGAIAGKFEVGLKNLGSYQ